MWRKLQAALDITLGLGLFVLALVAMFVAALGIFAWQGSRFTWNKVIQMGSR